MKTSKLINLKKKLDIGLKILFPSIMLICTSGYISYYTNSSFSILEIFIYLCFVGLYFYYFIFVVYKLNSKNIIDKNTGCLYQSEFVKYLSNYENVVYFTVSNLNELRIRIGFEKADTLLSKLIKKITELDDDILIGMITNNEFMILTNQPQKVLFHEVKKKFLEIKRERIDGIDFKIEYSIVKSEPKFNKLYLEAQNRLENKVDVNTENAIAISVDNAIKNYDYSLKVQRLKGEEELYYLNYRINCDYPDKLTQARLDDIIVKHNIEFRYYKNLLEVLLKYYDFQNRIIIKISPDFLRDIKFLFYMGEFFMRNTHARGKIIFEIFENDIYYDMPRFEEIIREYKDLDISFVLNRLGSASSFEYLKKLDFEFVVFDIEFNKFIKNEKIVLIYKNLFNLCKDLNIKTIMRFIDSQMLLDSIEGFNFDYYQGFLFYKDKNLKEMK